MIVIAIGPGTHCAKAAHGQRRSGRRLSARQAKGVPKTSPKSSLKTGPTAPAGSVLRMSPERFVISVARCIQVEARWCIPRVCRRWTIVTVTIDHYENFPVASVLCPPALRPPIAAIYRFARTADDIADEGEATADQRRTLLDRFEQSLADAAAGRPPTEWPQVFEPLARQIAAHHLPVNLLRDLLCAFRQDTFNAPYADRAALLDYCSRSANPIGRLLLHLVDVKAPSALARSDAICTALQLINFWQDLSVDLPRGRCYLPLSDARRYGVDTATLVHDSDASRALVKELCQWARQHMLRGAPLVFQVRGRFGWELRGVVQGGLRVLDKIEAQGCNAIGHRPTVGTTDLPLLLWRALWMPRREQTLQVSDRTAP